MTQSAQLITGNCLDVLKVLPGGLVQCVITFPPYYGLRDYGTAKWEGGDPACDHKPGSKKRIGKTGLEGGTSTSGHQQEGYHSKCPKCGAHRIDNQIGLEETPEAYVQKLVEIFREVKRVLKDDGTLWLNLGDSYAGNPAGNKTWGDGVGSNKYYEKEQIHQKIKKNFGECKQKDLLGIPWMVAFALRADGWYLRSDIIWHKPNPMPESVTDRPTRCHEYVFLLSKSPRYFFDNVAIQEPLTSSSILRLQQDNFDNQKGGEKDYAGTKRNRSARRALVNLKGRMMSPQVGDDPEKFANLTGRNSRDVWTITTKPYPEAHFATFPEDLPEKCIKAGTSLKGECPVCGKAWVRVIETGKRIKHASEPQTIGSGRGETADQSKHAPPPERIQKGWKPQCECGAEPVPQTVMDIFNGSGTAGAVALRLGRSYIGIELNPKYVKLSEERMKKVTLPMILE